MSEVLFNINNLISPKIRDKLNNCITIIEKIEILFRLTEFISYFNPDEISEIKTYWLEKTGEAFTAIYLTEDDKEFVREYSHYFPDLNKVKELINGLCNKLTYDDCIASAQAEMEQVRNEQLQEAIDKSQKIHTDLKFDDDIISKQTKKMGLKERLERAREKADAINNKK